MKPLILLSALLLSFAVSAQQHNAVPHGMVYGSRPNTVGMMDASKVYAFMDTKTRISTTIKGKIIKVTNPKGGWFELDAGNGKYIAAHFKTYNVNIPADLAGHTVIIEGVAEKQFVADDNQHLAGGGGKQQSEKTDRNQILTFEVTGMSVQ